MKILRHEAGHAIDNAYRLRTRRRRQQIFGPSYMQYPKHYQPKPYSKSFVLHLDSWYAQSHPDEDFAETFAVWLNPNSDWRPRYVDWPALKKLEYMDELMTRDRRQADARHHAAPRRAAALPAQDAARMVRAQAPASTACEHPHFYDRDLRRLFSDKPEYAANMKAARFIARVRKDVRRMVAAWTGEYQYTIDQVLERHAQARERDEPAAEAATRRRPRRTSSSWSRCRR